MSEIRAIATISQYTAGDNSLGVFFAIDVVYATWRQHLLLDDLYYVELPLGTSLTAERIWKFVAQFVSSKINRALIAASQTALATCTDAHVLIPGFGDWKLGQQPPENIFQGYRERVRRIPRTAGGITHITNAQDSITMTNHENEFLSCTMEFLSDPDLQGEIEYRLFLFPHPPDLSLNDGAGLDSILIGTPLVGAPSRLTGSRAFASLHATLRGATTIQGVLGLKRKQVTMAITPADAGTVAKANIAWGEGTYELGICTLTASCMMTVAGVVI